VPDHAETLKLERARDPRARDQAVDRTGRGAGPWDDLLVILSSGLYLWISLFTLRGVPFLLGGDQVYFWLYAQRMRGGELPYRDFLQFTPPGTDLVFVAAFRIFGQHIWVANLVALMLGVVLAWICFRIGRAFLACTQAMLAAGLFLVLIYGKVMNATHHWFSALAVLAAVAVLMRKVTSGTVAAAGVLLGVAMFFTQTRGPAALAGFTVYLLWERAQTHQSWRECGKGVAILFGSCAISWVILVGYFIAAAGMDRTFYWLVTYILRYHSSTASGLGLPEDFAWRHASSYAQVLAVYATLPVVYAVSLAGAWTQQRQGGPRSDGPRMLLTLAGVSIMLEVAMSPNWLRVYCAAAPAVLLLIWVTSRFGRLQRCATGLLWVVLVCAVCWSAWSRRREQSMLVSLPAGPTMTTRTLSAKLEWIARNTKPGEYFFQAAWPGAYLPLQLRDPAFVDALLPADESRPELVERTIRQIEGSQIGYILWSPRLNEPMLPAQPETYHLGPFRDYLQTHFRRVMVFPDLDEIWQRQ